MKPERIDVVGAHAQHSLPVTPVSANSSGTGGDPHRGASPHSASNFVPPFCPADRCAYHLHPPHRRRWFWRWGSFPDRLHGSVARFRCLGCGKVFSAQTFSVDYYVKRRIDLRSLLVLLRSASSVRSMARFFGCSTGTIANRLDRLTRQALVMLCDTVAVARAHEPLAADGFRSFTVSQYFPCDINLLVGQRTDLLYGLDYSLLPRTGSMTATQRSRWQTLSRTHPSDPTATRRSFSRLLDIVTRIWISHDQDPCTLFTDKHPAYRSAWNSHSHIQHLVARRNARHLTVSSRRARTAANPLRAVNYMDREIRKDRADHCRQTVCFARSVNSMLGRLAIYFSHRNLMKPRRILGSRSPGPLETLHRSHAAAAAIAPVVQAKMMIGFIHHRRFLSREVLPGFYRQLWTKRVPTPLKQSPEYLPRFALQ